MVFQILYQLGHPLVSERAKKCVILRPALVYLNSSILFHFRFSVNWGTLSVPRTWVRLVFNGRGLMFLISGLVFVSYLVSTVAPSRFRDFESNLKYLCVKYGVISKVCGGVSESRGGWRCGYLVTLNAI
jgi:hypothetical protein